MDNYKQTIMKENVKRSTNGLGQNMNVSFKTMRFPVIEGVQAKITLKSNVTGTFMNIGFMKDVENTVHGNIADCLLDTYPDHFRLIKVNGHRVSEGNKETERSKIKKELIEELKKEFEIKPKKGVNTKRDRIAETQITKQEVPTDVNTKNTFVENVKSIKETKEGEIKNV